MWDLRILESSPSSFRFTIANDEQVLSNRELLQLLQDSAPFRSFYNDILKECGFEAFYWENKPVTNNTLDSNYECNLVNSDYLAGVYPDEETFARYFKKELQVVTFPNLGNDALLVVPCPQKQPSVYTHIGNFVREAGEQQIHAF